MSLVQNQKKKKNHNSNYMESIMEESGGSHKSSDENHPSRAETVNLMDNDLV